MPAEADKQLHAVLPDKVKKAFKRKAKKMKISLSEFIRRGGMLLLDEDERARLEGYEVREGRPRNDDE